MASWKQQSVCSLVLLICLALFATSIATAGATTAELIANGSFDEGSAPAGSLPDHWISYQPFPNSVVASAEGQGRNGTRCGMVQTKSDVTAVLVSNPPSPVAPGEELTVSGWCRVEGISSHSGGVVVC